MKLIREPLHIDLYVDSRPMTKEDEKAISDYVKADELKHSKKAERKSTSTNMVLPKPGQIHKR